ncbi:hypothetical protein HJC23_005801, partial [Cyclotella cryptica]
EDGRGRITCHGRPKSRTQSTNEEEGYDRGDITVCVEAPMTLAEGYLMDVEHNGQVFPVTVPGGGVNQGQTFQVQLPLPEPSAPPHDEENLAVISDNFVIPQVLSETPISTTTKLVIRNADGTQSVAEETVYSDGTVVKTSVTKSLADSGLFQASRKSPNRQSAAERQVLYADVPMGPWRYPLCQCCKSRGQGMLCMACCCTFIPMGQILQRLKLNPSGGRGTYENTCIAWTGLWISFVFCFIMAIASTPFALFTFFAVFIYAIYALTMARYHMRMKYRIPSRCCKSKACNPGCDDCCCVFWCMPCVICQMLTHTHDQTEYNYKCLSHTGLDKDAPQIE